MNKSAVILVLILLLPSVCSIDIFYSEYDEALFARFVDVRAVATSEDMVTGIVGRIRVGLIDGGQGNIVFDSRTLVDQETVSSVVDATRCAENASNFDYFITYDLHSEAVSGGSTGSAVAYAIREAVASRIPDPNVLFSGRVDSECNMIPPGGLFLKLISAANAGITEFNVAGTGMDSYYEEVSNGVSSYYIVREVNLTDYAISRNISLRLISNLNQKI